MCFSGEIEVSAKFETDKEIRHMREPYVDVTISTFIFMTYRNSLQYSTKDSNIIWKEIGKKQKKVYHK